jgi:hypothetical protein
MPAAIERLLRDDAERNRLVRAASERCRTSLTLEHSIRQIAGLVAPSLNQ